MSTETVDLGGGRLLGIERLGAAGGHPVLYFHGLPGSRLDFADAGPEFEGAGLSVIAVDRPGFGLSTRVRGRALLDWPRDVAALADRLGLGRFAVVGYSSGGKYALACAHALADGLAVAGVIAGTGPPDMPGFRASLDPLDRVSQALAARARPLALGLWGAARAVALRRRAAVVAQFEKQASEADKAALADPAVRRSLARTLQEALRPGAAGVVDDYAVEARPWGFGLEGIRAPVLVWHGDDDRVVPLAHSRYVAERVPGAELRILDRAGHLPANHLGAIARDMATAFDTSRS